MTAAEFLAALDTLGMKREAFAERFGLHLSAVYRWAQGTRAVPPWVPVVIEMIKEEPQ